MSYLDNKSDHVKGVTADGNLLLVDKEYYEGLIKALMEIAQWKLPVVYSDGKQCSFGYLHGSNGERDFMRGLAGDFLNK